MRLLFVLDGAPYEVPGIAYPAGVGVPRQAERLLWQDRRYLVIRVTWELDYTSTPVLLGVIVEATSEGVPQQ